MTRHVEIPLLQIVKKTVEVPEVPPLQFTDKVIDKPVVAQRQISIHGPDCSDEYRDSTVAIL